MKKIIVLALVFALCFSFSACGGNNTSEASKSGSAEESTQAEPLTIVDSGYTTTGEDGDFYVQYAIKIKNPNKDVAAEMPTVRITARDENDKVLETEDQTFNVIYPQTTIGYGFQAMGVNKKPAKVDFEIIDNEDIWVSVDTLAHPSIKPFKADGISLTKDEYSGATVSGEIINNNNFSFESVAVSVLFKDKNGKLKAAESTIVDSVDANGKTPFTIDILSDYYTKDYEICIMDWSL